MILFQFILILFRISYYFSFIFHCLFSLHNISSHFDVELSLAKVTTTELSGNTPSPFFYLVSTPLTGCIFAHRDNYGINPDFVHVDKDMGEIGGLKAAWNVKISLCWWHLR